MIKQINYNKVISEHMGKLGRKGKSLTIDGIFYNSVIEAYRELNINVSVIVYRCASMNYEEYICEKIPKVENKYNLKDRRYIPQSTILNTNIKSYQKINDKWCVTNVRNEFDFDITDEKIWELIETNSKIKQLPQEEE